MKTAYIDVDTQIDFVFPSGALYVPGAERILARVGELNREAAAAGHVLIATMDAHAEDDVEFQSWPHHCVAGTLGQRKPDITLAPGARIIEKQTTDCFSNPQMEFLLRDKGITDAVVYGVVTEICVLNATRGLLDRGIRVTVDRSAIRELSATSRDLFFEEVRARGGVVA